MTTGILDSDTGQTLRAVQDTPRHALAVLTDPDSPLLDAVVWLSAHLAAVEYVVRPEFRRCVDPDSVAQQLEGAVRIEHMLRALEQQLTGDALAAHIDPRQMVRSFTQRLLEYIDQERRLLDVLRNRLTPEEQRHVAARYQRALERGPTRPHPHAPHGRMLGSLAYRVNGPRDRLMDTLDSRHVPTPHRPRPPVKTSRWGDYLLGASRASSGRDDR